MRIVFAGTPAFAAAALQALIESHFEVALVLTQPDRPAGRGLRESPSAVKQLALRHGLTVAQPLTLRNEEILEQMRSTAAQALVVAAYGLILPRAVLDIFPAGCINIHASLLPRWRGAAPIQRAILAGDGETGITIMQMEAGLDTGPMLMQARLQISDDDTAATLHDKLTEQGAALIVAALPQLEQATLDATPQPSDGVTYAEKIQKREAAIDWQLPAAEIERRIRALQPFPVMQTTARGETLRIWRAVVGAEMPLKPGEIHILNREKLLVGSGAGTLEILELQRAGGNRLAARDFLRGAKLISGDYLNRSV